MPKRKSIKFKIAVFGTLFFCLLVGVGYLLLWSPIFKIGDIIIFGNQEISSQQIQDIARQEIYKKILGFLPKNNIFLIDTDALKQTILQEISQISRVVISNELAGLQGAKLAIVIEERQPRAIVCRIGVPTLVGYSMEQSPSTNSSLRLKSGLQPADQEIFNQCFYVDKQGIAFKSAPQTKGSLILQLAAPYDLSLGAEAVKPPVLRAVEQLKKSLAETVSGLSIDYFIIISSQEIYAKTQAGWLIYFDINTDLSHQAQILKELLKQKITNTKNLEYIDLRLGEKVFYKETPKN